jgi:hypothetical protein
MGNSLWHRLLVFSLAHAHLHHLSGTGWGILICLFIFAGVAVLTSVPARVIAAPMHPMPPLHDLVKALGFRSNGQRLPVPQPWQPSANLQAQAIGVNVPMAATLMPSFAARRFFGTELDHPHSVAVGDMDGDGDLDIVTGNYHEQSAVYLNDGSGNFTTSHPFGLNTDYTNSVAVGDMDGDGDLDIVKGNFDQQSTVYFNDGSGNFATARAFGPGTDDTRSVAVADLDGDGDLDIVKGNFGQQSVVYLNDGLGNFPASGSRVFGLNPDRTESVAVGDIDGDGNLDIIVGRNILSFSQGGPTVIYRNDGLGNFTMLGSYGTVMDTTAVAVGDMDGDSDLDIVTANGTQQNMVYLNDGLGSFNTFRTFGTDTDLTVSVVVGDVDADGDLDIAQGESGKQNVVYLNDGVGNFTTFSNFGTGTDWTQSVAIGDMDSDGHLDLVTGNSVELNAIYLNDGSGNFTSRSSRPFSPDIGDIKSVAVGDMDSDGDLDIVAGNQVARSKVYLNDGLGNFTTSHPFGPSAPWNSSVAVGDMDGDGDLDIVTGRTTSIGDLPNVVYFNDGLGNFTTSRDFGPSTNHTLSVAVGDMDGDGDLDIVLGTEGVQNSVYFNDGLGNFTVSRDFGPGTNDTVSLAVGDMNGDGNLDIVASNSWAYSTTLSGVIPGSAQDAVYLNDGLGNFPMTGGRYFGTGTDSTLGRIGDMDGDGDLDIVSGNTVYLNDGPGNFTTSRYVVPAETRMLGDMDGDGDLDIVSGSTVYLNDGLGNFPISGGRSFGTNTTDNMALGDMDADGNLDIVVDSYNGQSAVYLNGLSSSAQLVNRFPMTGLTRPNPLVNANFEYTNPLARTPVIPITYTLSDPENDPVRSIRAYYSPDGGGKWYPAMAAGGTMTTNLPTRGYALSFDGVDDWAQFADVPVTRISNNFTLELWFKSNDISQTNKYLLYRSGIQAAIRYGLTPGYVEFYSNAYTGSNPQPGSQIPIPDTNWHHIAYTYNGSQWSGYLDGHVVFSTPRVFSLATTAGFWVMGSYIPTTFNGVVDEVRIWNIARTPAQIQAFMTQPVAGTTSGLVANWRFNEGHGIYVYDSTPNHANGFLNNYTSYYTFGPTWTVPALPYIYQWDVFKSGFFGQSDNVVFRMEAYPSLKSGPNGVPLFQRPYASAITFPFRVRGQQVRVLSETLPISNAIVYRLRAGQTSGAQPFSDSSGQSFRTDGQGYLQGRGEIKEGDRLVALLPISATDSYTLYATSAAPTLTGLNLYTVTQAGVQTLTVSAANPLILFNLDVSLEWDARQDTQFMTQLTYNLQRTSDFLYDWTNGQAALGDVRIYHDREKWDEAHIQIYATNRLRPNAAQGGIVSDVITDPITSTITYDPGNVHIGAVWDRYGDTGGALGEDWPHALAHELGHYAFFLDDAYLGLNASGGLIPIDTCGNTAMSDPYREDYSEFRARDAAWQAECGNTLAAKETGRADWETITAMYPSLFSTVNTGPSGLPLNVTQITEVQPVTPSIVIPVPIFNLTFNGSKVQPGGSARAILYQTGSDRLIDLGNPTLDQVNARGARLGDRLCVYEVDAQRLGCEILTAGDEELALIARPAWNPDILVSPVNSSTINLGVNIVGLPPNAVLRARLYPLDGPASPTITLSSPPLFKVYLPLILRTSSGSGVATLPAPDGNAAIVALGNYNGTFTLAEPAPQGIVQIWVEEDGVRREAITDYSLGGSPAFRHGRGAFRHGRGAFRHGRGAPTESSDGQVLIFGDGLIFDEGEFFALQGVSSIANQPLGTTLIGRAYRLIKSAGAPSLVGTSISFNYAGRDVPPGEEDFLHVYFFDGNTWHQLTTTVDPNHNIAVAAVPAVANGQGLYALLSGIEIPLYGPGWNPIVYPVQGSKPVAQALASINGAYGLVYRKSLTDTLDPWKVYAVGAPTWINDLATLEFAQSYWISVTRSITLEVTGGATSAPSALPSPPMTVYGTAPFAGTVTAWVNGVPCGQGATQVVNNQIVYTLNIQPNAPGGKAGCGAAGRSVTFRIGAQAMTTSIGWDIDRVWNLPLTP